MNRHITRFMAVRGSTTHFFLGLSLLLSLCLTSSAWAGTWGLHSYIYNGQRKSERQYFNTWNTGYEFVHDAKHGDNDNGPSVFREATSKTVQWGISAELVCRALHQNGQQNNTWDFTASKASLQFSVRPVFVWNRNEVYDEETDTFIPDPNDNPDSSQGIYVLEYASAVSQNWLASGLKNGLKSPMVDTSDQLGNIRNESAGTRFNLIPVGKLRWADGQEVFDGPTISMGAAVNFPALTLTWGGERSAHLSNNYRVQIVSFNLSVRRLNGTTTNGPLNFEGATTVAAGKIDNDLHKAEVLMQVRVGDYGNPIGVPNIPKDKLPELKLYNDEGEEDGKAELIDAEQGTAPNSYPVDKTDANGYIVRNFVKSSNRLTKPNLPGLYNPVTVVVEDKAYNNPFTYYGGSDPRYVQIQQVWGTAEWNIGDNGEPNGASNLKFGTAMPIAFKTLLQENVPIKGHTLKLFVSRIRLTEVDEDTQQLVERLYITNEAEAAQSNDPNVLYRTPEQLTDYTKDFVTFSSETASETADGVYTSSVTVKAPDKVVVEELFIGVQDQGVYLPR